LQTAPLSKIPERSSALAADVCRDASPSVGRMNGLSPELIRIRGPCA
jgi:hypothetical protein